MLITYFLPVNFRYKELALIYHPDRQDGNLKIMQVINAHYQHLQANKSKILANIPVFIQKSGSPSETSQIFLIQIDGNVKQQIADFYKVPANSVIGWDGDIKPWNSIKIIMKPVEEKKINHTDIEFLRKNYLEVLISRVDRKWLYIAIDNFLVSF